MVMKRRSWITPKIRQSVAISVPPLTIILLFHSHMNQFRSYFAFERVFDTNHRTRRINDNFIHESDDSLSSMKHFYIECTNLSIESICKSFFNCFIFRNKSTRNLAMNFSSRPHHFNSSATVTVFACHRTRWQCTKVCLNTLTREKQIKFVFEMFVCVELRLSG